MMKSNVWLFFQIRTVFVDFLEWNHFQGRTSFCFDFIKTYESGCLGETCGFTIYVRGQCCWVQFFQNNVPFIRCKDNFRKFLTVFAWKFFVLEISQSNLFSIQTSFGFYVKSSHWWVRQSSAQIDDFNDMFCVKCMSFDVSCNSNDVVYIFS